MRLRFLVELVPAEDLYVVPHFYQNSIRYLLRWLRSRICHLIQLRFQVCVEDLCVV